MHACLSFPVSLSWRSNVFHLSIPVPILHSSERQDGADLCSVKKKKNCDECPETFLTIQVWLIRKFLLSPYGSALSSGPYV